MYAQLQLAQDKQAAQMIEKAVNTPERGDRPPTMANYTALAAMPARYVLERADWDGAAALPVKPTEHAMADSLTHFTRGLGMARTGDLRGAKTEIDVMKSLQARMQKGDDAYWADRTQEQIAAVSAWVSLAEGAPDKAIALMRSAADGEDGSIKHVAMENRLYPLRELLGDLLLEAHQPKAAMAEYQKALKDHPNRFRGIYGVARTAEALGNRQMAAEYYGKLIDLAKKADGSRPEVQRAEAYLRSR